MPGTLIRVIDFDCDFDDDFDFPTISHIQGRQAQYPAPSGANILAISEVPGTDAKPTAISEVPGTLVRVAG